MIQTVGEIIAAAIDWYVGDDNVFTLILKPDGSLMRMGNGRPAWEDRDLYVGQAPQPLLPGVLANLSPDLLTLDGGYQIDPVEGVLCRLILRFWSESDANAVELRYGAISGGLPHEIPQYLSGAIEHTEPWYQAQRTVAGKS